MASHCLRELFDLTGSDAQLSVYSADELLAGEGALQQTGCALVYGWRPDAAHDALLARLTNGAVQKVSRESTSTGRLTWSAFAMRLARQLPGMELNLALGSQQFCSFESTPVPGGASLETFAFVDGRPWFACVHHGGRSTYLLAVGELPAADVRMTSGEQELPLVSAAIALLLYARTHFPERTWFPGGAYGNFVIDDPLLRPTYGFLRHDRLADHVHRLQAAATIAFIPWNAGRSRQPTIELYRRTSNLSLCVHGWEHTDDEFCSSDLGELQQKAAAAMQAMHAHSRLTGLPFEPVMVFPKGRFSSLSLRALADAGFLAATNSTFLASDHAGEVRLKHLLEPAVLGYGALPLLRRRGPAYLERFRYDLALGRPLILVEHHEYFRDEDRSFVRAIDRVKAIAPSLAWRPLGEIARRLHTVRVPRHGHRDVKFYSRHFRVAADQACTHHFVKAEPGTIGIRAVTVNGRPVDFQFQHDMLRFDVEAGAMTGDLDIVVNAVDEDVAHAAPVRSLRRRLSVATRRYLSELRDNHIVTNPLVNSVHGRLKAISQAVGC